MSKPLLIPYWATSGAIEEPLAPKKAIGWIGGATPEKPPAEYFNWLHNLAGQWIEYLAASADGRWGLQHGVVAGLDVSKESGTGPTTLYKVGPGQFISKEGDLVELGADISVSYSISPPSANDGSTQYRNDMVVATYDPTTKAVTYDYMEDIDATAILAMMDYTSSNVYPLALIRVSPDGLDYLPQNKVQFKFYSGYRANAGVITVGDGRGQGMFDMGMFGIALAIEILSQQSGGTVKIVGQIDSMGWTNTDTTPTCGAALKSNITIEGAGRTRVQAPDTGDTLVESVFKVQGKAVTGGVIVSAGVSPTGKAYVRISGGDLTTAGKGALIVIVSSPGEPTNDGKRAIIVSFDVTKEIAYLVDESGEDMVLIDDTNVDFELYVVGAGFRNITIFTDNVAFGKYGLYIEYCEDLTLENVRFRNLDGENTKSAINLDQIVKSLTLMNVETDDNYNTSIFFENDADTENLVIQGGRYEKPVSLESTPNNAAGYAAHITGVWFQDIFNPWTNIKGPANLTDRLVWVIASISWGSGADAFTPTSDMVARDVQMAKDGSSLAVNYRGGSAFTAGPDTVVGFEVRRENTGIYQVRVPGIVGGAGVYVPGYSSADFLVSFSTYLTMLTRVQWDNAGSYWEMNTDIHDGTPTDTACYFMILGTT